MLLDYVLFAISRFYYREVTGTAFDIFWWIEILDVMGGIVVTTICLGMKVWFWVIAIIGEVAIGGIVIVVFGRTLG